MWEHIFPGCPQTRRENAVTDTCCVALWAVRQSSRQEATTDATNNSGGCQVMLLQKSQSE